MDPETKAGFDEIRGILASVARSQAAAEARMDRAEARMDRAETRMDRAEARMDRAEARMDRTEAAFEKRMRGLGKLVQIGMKELVRLERLSRETDQKLNILIDAQQRTDAALRAFLESLRKGRNGR